MNNSWTIDPKTFSTATSEREKILYFLRFASLAPSSHNIQPWSFCIRDNSTLVISLEQKRLLQIGDSNNRQASISLGCSLANFIVAANNYGYSASWVIQSNFEIFVHVKKTAQIDTSTFGESIQAILNRSMDRRTFNAEPLSSEVIHFIESHSSSTHAVHVISDSDRRLVISDIILDATAEAMRNEKFREELSRYVIHNKSLSPIGMPGFTIGIPTFFSYLAPLMLRSFNLSKFSNKKDEIILKKYTPAFVSISSTVDDFKSWVETGLIAENIFLAIMRYGMRAGVWAAPIQVGNHYKSLKRIIGIKSRPQILFRVGVPVEGALKHSPRLDINQLINNECTI